MLAEALLEFETLSSDEIRHLFKTGKVERANLVSEQTINADFIPRSGEKKRSRNKQSIIHVNVVD